MRAKGMAPYVLASRLVLAFFSFACGSVNAQTTDPLLFYDVDGLSVRGHFQAGVNGVSEQNLFWDFADTVAADSGYEGNANWLEVYVKPGVSFEQRLDDGAAIYGKVTGVASYTFGTDGFDTGDTGRVTLEEAHLGFRTPISENSELDISVGPKELKLGTGMLIANGATSGFERGALKLGPRKSWEMTGIASLSHDTVKGTAFYIDPNELSSNDGKNRLAGFDIRTDSPEGGYAGLTYAHVLNLDSPYPQAAPGGIGPPTITPGAREGLNAVSLYAKTSPFVGPLEDTFFAVDLAYEWNDRIDMNAWAGRVQAGYTFKDLPWSPTLTYSYQTFSGDDPGTAELERFDPLYYEGSPSAWSTGSKSSMLFINSNVQAHGLALRLAPTQRDTITLRYSHIRANELRSPIQFGQATRVDFSNNVATVIPGVTNAHLSDDFFIEYSRIINPNTYLTAGLSVAIPGKGISDVVDGRTSTWTGGFVNVVVNF